MITPASAQLDETCKITINGQTANVGLGGEFQIRNVPAGPDLFRVYAICTKDGKTRYGRSELFQIIANRSFFLSELDMQWSDTPFPTVESITAEPDTAKLSSISEATQIRVIANLSDGKKKDVTTCQCCHRGEFGGRRFTRT
jgi:hypothetical protein